MAKQELVPTGNEPRYLPIEVDGFSWQEIVKENLGGQAPGTFDLPRIRIPSGGGIAWTVPTLEGPDAMKELRGVIIKWQTMRAYWATAFEDSGAGTPPDCNSADGEWGKGNPGGNCATCPLNEFGSGKDNSKACKEVRMLFVLRFGDILPVAIPLAPMSIKPCKDYFMGLASEKRVPFYGVETVLTLEQAQNKGNIKYSKAKFGYGRALTSEEVAYVKQFREAFGTVIDAQIARDDVDGTD